MRWARIGEKASDKKKEEKRISKLNSIGVKAYQMGEYPKALSYLKKALEIGRKTLGEEHPIVGTIYSNIGMVYNSMGDFGKALEYYDKSLAINPRNVKIWNAMGKALYQADEPVEAIKCFDTALKMEPKNMSALNGEWLVFIRMGMDEEAIRLYGEMVAIDPKIGDEMAEVSLPVRGKEDCRTQGLKGFVLALIGRHHEAMVYFNNALEMDENCTDAWVSKGYSLAILGQFQEAINCFDKALSIDPTDSEALKLKEITARKLEHHRKIEAIENGGQM